MSITRRPTRRSVPKISRVTKTLTSPLRLNDTTGSREKGTFFPLEAKSFLRNTSRMLKNPFSPRLLKKVQMQGDAPGTHP